MGVAQCDHGPGIEANFEGLQPITNGFGQDQGLFLACHDDVRLRFHVQIPGHSVQGDGERRAMCRSLRWVRRVKGELKKERSAIGGSFLQDSIVRTVLQQDDEQQDDDDETCSGDVYRVAVAVILFHFILQILPFGA